MNYFLDFSTFYRFYAYNDSKDEKQVSPEVKSNGKEEKVRKTEGIQRDSEEESTDISETMGSSAQPKKGWLDWQFWKKNDNTGGPFSAFRRNNKATGAFTFRKDINDAIKVKETGKGDEHKDVMFNRGGSSGESSKGQSQTTENNSKIDKSVGEETYASDHEKDVPLVTYNSRPNGTKDVALNMKKVEALRSKKHESGIQREMPVRVLEEKYSPVNGQPHPKKPCTEGPVPSTQSSINSPQKQKIDATAGKTKKTVRQLPAQRRTGIPQVTPTTAFGRSAQRAENIPKVKNEAKILAVKKSHEKVRVEKIDKKCDVKKTGEKKCEAKKMVGKKNDGSTQLKTVPEEPVVPRQKCVKIDERPSILPISNHKALPKIAAGNQAKKNAGVKEAAVKTGNVEQGRLNNVLRKATTNAGSNEIDNATVPKGPCSQVSHPWPSNKAQFPNAVAPNAQHPGPDSPKTQNHGPENQRRTRPQNGVLQVPKRPIASTGPKNYQNPQSSNPYLSPQQSVCPQGLNPRYPGPQNPKAQNLGPQIHKPCPQDLSVPQNQKPQSPCHQSPLPRAAFPKGVKAQEHSPKASPKPQSPYSQPLNPQQPHPQSQQNPYQQGLNPRALCQVGPAVSRPYSEVVSPQQPSPQFPNPNRPIPQGSNVPQQPSSQVPNPQTPNLPRPHPEGVSPQASPQSNGPTQPNVQPRPRPKRALSARRRAPGLAKPVVKAAETQPATGEATRQDPKESDNVPKRKIVVARDGRAVAIEPNMPVTLPGNLVTKTVYKAPDAEKKCLVQNTTKEIPKSKLEVLAKRPKPIMKDASTATPTPSPLVDAAVQAPDEEENAGDEIHTLLVKRPWDTERVMKMQVLLDEKLVVIGRMKDMSRKQRDELKSTKKRCVELEAIIKASNMQGKPQLVTQVNELTEIKNELIAEVTNLTVELERERTNVKSLKTELIDIKAQLNAARKKGANPANQCG